MDWVVVPERRPREWVIVPNTVRARQYRFNGWQGGVLSIDWAHPAADAVLSFRVPVKHRQTYSIREEDRWDLSAMHIGDLPSDDPISAAILLCMSMAAKRIIVLESAIESSAKVINANPDTRGCHPAGFGIGCPDFEGATPASTPLDILHVPVPNFCPDKRVWIIGGGPSVATLDLDRLLQPDCSEDFILGCNDAIQLPHCQAVCFGDRAWAEIHTDWLDQFTGPIFTRCDFQHPHVQNIRQAGTPWSCDPSQVAFATNTGLMAINLAWLGGAKEAILLGFDMHLVNGQSNWYKNKSIVHEYQFKTHRDYAMMMAAKIAGMCPEYKVLNANLESEMQAFPKIDPEVLLPGLVKK